MRVATTSVNFADVILKPLGDKEAALKFIKTDMAPMDRQAMGFPHLTSVRYVKKKTGELRTVLVIGPHQFLIKDTEGLIREKIRPGVKLQEWIWVRYAQVKKKKVECWLEFTIKYAP